MTTAPTLQHLNKPTKPHADRLPQKKNVCPKRLGKSNFGTPKSGFFQLCTFPPWHQDSFFSERPPWAERSTSKCFPQHSACQRAKTGVDFDLPCLLTSFYWSRWPSKMNVYLPEMCSWHFSLKSPMKTAQKRIKFPASWAVCHFPFVFEQCTVKICQKKWAFRILWPFLVGGFNPSEKY